ncbi:MAG: ABC transporter ATP-binding protein [Porticoccaceae bacterium]|jgi:iron(III) transport system ATP-binding protein|nr:ABC transporter ATP-binding protein [Porticoccaceae bacterium]
MLKVSGLSLGYGATTVVEDFNIELGDSEVLTLVGPTGCGKTTILHALAGLVPIDSGEISLNSWHADANNLVPPEKRNVGMVFQDFALFPHLTVEENVSFKLSDPARASHWLDLLGMSDFRHKKPSTLSGGQKQRVALARTLAHQPALVLLDEPLSNLDAALKDSLRWEIKTALKTAGVAAIWVTHDQEEALSVGDRIGVLQDGKLIQLADPETCFSRPVNHFVAGFLGDASYIRGMLTNGAVKTEIGEISAVVAEGVQGEVDLMLRPDDMRLLLDSEASNGEILWARYEGATWLYGVALANGDSVQVRTSHEQKIESGQKVLLQLTSTHPLVAFGRD